jgi:hypothetical protein
VKTRGAPERLRCRITAFQAGAIFTLLKLRMAFRNVVADVVRPPTTRFAIIVLDTRALEAEVGSALFAPVILRRLPGRAFVTDISYVASHFLEHGVVEVLMMAEAPYGWSLHILRFFPHPWIPVMVRHDGPLHHVVVEMIVLIAGMVNIRVCAAFARCVSAFVAEADAAVASGTNVSCYLQREGEETGRSIPTYVM